MAPAATTDGTLHGSSRAELRWSGAFTSPEACPVTGCVVYRFALVGRPGEAADVTVSVHWRQRYDADLDLFVYGPEGSVVGVSAYDAGDTETVLLPAPPDGSYEVVVRPVNGRDLEYEGRIATLPPVRAEPLRDLLPDLVPLRARIVGMIGVREDGSTCRAEETAERQALRCLRFDQIVANLGTGPLELRYAADAVSLATAPAIRQRIRRSDGTAYDRVAGSYEFHAAHRHFHYTGFALTRLWAADPAGHRLGEAPVRSGRKNGFCLIDLLDIRWGFTGDPPPAYRRCHDVTAAGPPDRALVNGISTGWADLYDAILPDQYVEISGVPDGDYLLETIADPDNTVREADESNNAVTLHIRLTGDRVDILS